MERYNFMLVRILFSVCTLCAIVLSGYNFYTEKTLYSAIKGTIEGTGSGIGFSLFIIFIIWFSEKLIFRIRYSKHVDAVIKNISQDSKYFICLIIYLILTTTIGILSSLLLGKIIDSF
jgi:hypothetical protein